MTRAWGIAALVLLSSLTVATAQEPPQPEHQLLKEDEGTWLAVCKMSDGSESKGVMTSKMECGGLWLVSNFEADFGEQKFQGKGLDTYDPVTKKFVSVWVDSWATTPMNLEGTYDEKTKTMTMVGESRGPDGKPTKHRLTSTHKDKDHHSFEMFVVGADGKETSMMTIEYTRKK
jgi:hypothetical protein